MPVGVVPPEGVVSGSSCVSNSSAVCHRSAARFAIHRITTCDRAGARAGRCLSTGSGAWVTCAAKTS